MVGAGTKDTGFSLTRLTFQMTHATDSDTNAERDYIVDELSKCGVIGRFTSFKAGDRVKTEHVNHYITDGEVAVAEIEAPSAGSHPLRFILSAVGFLTSGCSVLTDTQEFDCFSFFIP